MIAALRCAVLLLALLVTACGEAAGSDAGGEPSAALSPTATSEATVDPSQPAASPAQPSQSAATRPTSQPAASPGSLQPSEGFAVATITLSSGDQRIRMPVWIADEPQLRQRGLMDRTSLPSNAGMLFVFEEPSDGGFWMKNTLIPLSIAFIDDDGRILETLDMQPCEADPCRVYTPGSTYRYALEANLGFFDEHGVASGWTADVGDAVGAAE
jgi:uncharacterized protein